MLNGQAEEAANAVVVETQKAFENTNRPFEDISCISISMNEGLVSKSIQHRDQVLNEFFRDGQICDERKSIYSILKNSHFTDFSKNEEIF